MASVQRLGVQNNLRSTWPGSDSVEKGLGVPVGKVQYEKCAAAVAKKGNRLLGCINHDIASWDKKAGFCLCSVFVTLHMNYSFQVWSPPSKNMLVDWRGFREGLQRWSMGWEAAIWGQAERNEFVQSWEKAALGRPCHPAPLFKGWLQGSFQGVTRKRWGVMSTCCSWRDSDQTEEENFSQCHWDNALRKVVNSPVLDNFKTQLDSVLCHLI